MATLDDIGEALKAADAAGDEEGAKRLAEFYKQAYDAQKEAEAQQPDERNEFAKGIVSGAAGVARGFVGTPLEDIGKSYDMPKLEEFGRGVREKAKSIEDYDASNIHSVEDVMHHPIDALQTSIGSIIPQIAPTLAATGVGAAGGAALGASFGPVGAGIGAIGGGIAGGLGAGGVQEYSEIREKQREHGQEDIGKAIEYATPASLLELLATYLETKSTKLLPAPLRTAIIDGAMKRIGTAGVAEAGTEYIQTALEQLGASEDITTPEASEERNLSAVLGGLGGAGLRGGIETVGKISGTPEATTPTEPVEPTEGPEVTPSPAGQPAAGTPLPDRNDVNIYEGVEAAGVDPFEHDELFDELIHPRHYESPESIDRLEEHLNANPEILPKDFDDSLWAEHIAKQRTRFENVAPKEEVKAETPTEEAVTEEPEEKAEEDTKFQAVHIPYESSETPGQRGASHYINYAGRMMTVRNINDTLVPFYLSTGSGGKKNVASGKWYPFFGVGKDGWINKTSEAGMNSYYGSPALKAAAEHLDNTVGDIRNDTTIPKVGAEGKHMDFINYGLTPTDFKSPDTVGRVKENVDKIVSAVDTPKEPKPSVSKSSAYTGHTVESLQPHLTPEMKRLIESGKLTLHDTKDTLPGEGHPDNVQGLTTPEGEVHLVADKLTPEALPKVAMHEMGVHVGMRGMVGDKVWGDLTSQALTTKGEAFDRARQSVPENTPEHLKGEETLAYLVENAPHLPIVKRAISAIKNWARTTFGARLNITESDIHHLAAKALRRESKTSERSTREGTAYAQKPRENSRIGMPHEQILQRVPELTESAKKMMDMLYDNGMLVRGTKGNLAKGVSNKDVEKFALSNPEFRKLAEAHDALVEKYKPVEPYQSLPTPATEAEMRGALKDKQVVHLYRPIPDGYKVKFRLDIPSYKNKGVWVATVHEGNTEKNSIFGVKEATPIAYYGHAVGNNPKFSIDEVDALKIADKTRDKYPLATVDAEYVNMSAKEAKRQADKAMTDPDWVQVGMDPERHSRFYDRKTMQPIKSGSKVIQIGSILMVKDPVYGKKSEYVYSVKPDIDKWADSVEERRKGNLPPKKEKPDKTVAESLRKASNKFETMYFSHDAALVNDARHYLEAAGYDFKLIEPILSAMNQAQTVNETSVSAEGTLQGELVFNKNLLMWEAVYNKNNVINLATILEDAGKVLNYPTQKMRVLWTEYMVSKRIEDLHRRADSYAAQADAETDANLKAELRKKAREELDKAQREPITRDEARVNIQKAQMVPALAKAEDMWHKIRENTIKTLVSSGRYSDKQARAYLDAAAYAPFYRIMDEKDAEDTIDSMAQGRYSASHNNIQKGQKQYKLKGSFREVDDMLDNIEKWQLHSFAMAMRAEKSAALVDTMRRYFPEGTIERVQGTKSDKANTVTTYFHGKKQYWKINDPLYRFAFTGSPLALGSLGFTAKAANLLRDSIVLPPPFAFVQVIKDVGDAMFLSGTKNPVMLTLEIMKQFGMTAANQFAPTKFAPTEAHLKTKRTASTGSKDTVGDARAVGVNDIAYHTHRGDETGKWKKVRQACEKLAMAGDNAIRQAIYQRTMDENPDNPNAERIAMQRAYDVINFRRRGASATLEAARQRTAFLGAFMQSMRATYQVLSGRGLSPTKRSEVYNRLIMTSVAVMALTLMHDMLMSDDDDYDKLDIKEKDTHIYNVIPGMKSTSFSLPQRLSIFSIPGIVMHHAYNMAKGKEKIGDVDDVRSEMRRAALASLVPPMGYSFWKPAFEGVINKDLYTMRPIVPERLAKTDTEEQYTADTSELGKLMGHLGVSPLKFDHFIKGWFGYAGSGLLAFTDGVAAAAGVPYKQMTHSEMIRKVPAMSAFMPKDKYEQAQATFYKVSSEVEQAVNTANKMRNEGRTKEAEAYKKENKKYFQNGVHGKLSSMGTQIDNDNKQIRKILASSNTAISPEEKAKRVKILKDRVGRVEAQVFKIQRTLNP
jgi:hypothetical protein